MIDNSDHSSIRLFSSGVPVIAIFTGVASWLAHFYNLDCRFLTICASSSSRPDQFSAA